MARGHGRAIAAERRRAFWIPITMTRSVALRGRLIVAGAALTGSLILVRRFLRRRADEVAEDVDRQLGLRLPALKLARRRDLAERLMSDPAVLDAAEAHALERGTTRADALRQARRYAREISPSFDAYLYFRVGVPLAGLLARSLYRVCFAGELAAPDGDASVILVMNHRSNMDYVLLAYLAAGRAAPSYAAGEWARVWPLGQLVRAMGSFFVRRGSGDDLYRRVLERFVQMAVEGGLTLAVFPEGGLSRDGRPREPKIGLLDYMLRNFDPEGDRNLIFVPVAVNYDWVPEDLWLLNSVDLARQPRGRLFASTTAYVARNLFSALRGRDRLGHAAVVLGASISARHYALSRGIDFSSLDREARIDRVQTLARDLMRALADIVPVVPAAAVARVFAEAPERALTGPEVETRVRVLFSDLEARSARVFPDDPNRAAQDGLRMLILRRMVLERDGLYRASSQNIGVLRYYAASISHLA